MLGDDAATTGPAHADRVRLVDEKHRAVGACGGVEVGDRGGFAVDAVDGVGDDERTLFGPIGESGAHRLVIAAVDDDHPRAGEPAPVDQRRVAAGVADDQVAAPRECGDGADVGQETGREDQRRLEPEEVGQLVLEVDVGLRRADHQSRRGRTATPPPEALPRPGDDVRVGREAEVVVRAEVDLRGAVPPDMGVAMETGRRAVAGRPGEPGEADLARGIRSRAGPPGANGRSDASVMTAPASSTVAPEVSASVACTAAWMPETMRSTSSGSQTNGGIV